MGATGPRRGTCSARFAGRAIGRTACAVILRQRPDGSASWSAPSLSRLATARKRQHTRNGVSIAPRVSTRRLRIAIRAISRWTPGPVLLDRRLKFATDAHRARTLRPCRDRVRSSPWAGAGSRWRPGNALLDEHALALTGVECPRVCFLPTASGDADHYIVRFYRAFPAGRCQPSHVSLFRRDGGACDLAAHLLAQDLVYVGGGSVISLLGTWTRARHRRHAARRAWEDGVVMAGLSAGSLCWFEQGVTAFHGESRRGARDGLPPPLQRRSLRRQAGAPRRVPARASRTGCRRATAPATARRCTSSAPSSPRW